MASRIVNVHIVVLSTLYFLFSYRVTHVSHVPNLKLNIIFYYISKIIIYYLLGYCVVRLCVITVFEIINMQTKVCKQRIKNKEQYLLKKKKNNTAIK